MKVNMSLYNFISFDSFQFQPLRPFIITKDMLQKQVYGLGYPSIPTMTIEEFFDKKVEEGSLHAHG